MSTRIVMSAINPTELEERVMKSVSVFIRRSGLAAIAGGTIIAVLGAIAAVDADVVGGVWFGCAAVAIGLFVAALRGLALNTRDAAGRRVRRTLTVATFAFVLFGLAHVYAIADEDTAILLFSVFMVVGALALIAAGIGLVRADVGRGWRRGVPLLCGAWPIATVPAGAAIGDVPHFLAVAVWGVCWIALGASLLTADSATATTTPRSVGASVTS
jgi:hypothetical protein